MKIDFFGKNLIFIPADYTSTCDVENKEPTKPPMTCANLKTIRIAL